MPIPLSLPWMESADAKLARAIEHFQSYNTAEGQYLKTVEHKIVSMHNPATGARWLVFYESDQFPPIRLSAIAGDVLFNLRSALDSLVCGLVRKSNARTECELQEFPIYTERDGFDNAVARGRLTGVPDAAVHSIRRLQPYHSADNSRKLQPLWLIHDLNRRDKHRGLHLTLGATQRGSVALLDATGRQVYETALPATTGLGPVTIPLPANLPVFVRAHAHGRYVVAFRAEEALADRPVHNVLAACIKFVELKVFDQVRIHFRA